MGLIDANIRFAAALTAAGVDIDDIESSLPPTAWRTVADVMARESDDHGTLSLPSFVACDGRTA